MMRLMAVPAQVNCIESSACAKGEWPGITLRHGTTHTISATEAT